jgi:hypothetical protein
MRMSGLAIVLILGCLWLAGCGGDEPDELAYWERTVGGIDAGFGATPTPAGVYASTPLASSLDDSQLPGESSLAVFMPRPGNQRTQSSCVGWAVAYLKTYQEKKEEDWDQNANDHVFSPAFIYNQINGAADNGSFIHEALELIRDVGAVSLARMPYDYLDYTTPPSQRDIDEAAKYRIQEFRRVNNSISQIKAQLVTGSPVVLGIDMDTSLWHLREDEVYDRYGQGELGAHAICLVGYDDAIAAYKFINSWGSGWAGDGYGWVSYGWVTQHGSERYVAIDLPNDHVSPPDDGDDPVDPPDDPDPDVGPPKPGDVTVYTSADAMVTAQLPDNNYGRIAGVDLAVDADDTSWVYMKFDIRDAIAAAGGVHRPRRAGLTMRFRGEGEPVRGVAYRAGAPWNEGSITWNNKPLKVGGGVSFTVPGDHPENQAGDFTFDILDLADAWFAGSPNNGVVMWLDRPTNPNKAYLLDVQSRETHPERLSLEIDF